MITVPGPLQPQYASGASTLCKCLKITRRDGHVLGITTLDRPLVVDGVTYVPGMDVSAIASSAGLAVDNLDVTILPDQDISEEDLIAGLWDQAAFTLFECNYLAPGDGIVTLKRGTTGEASASRGAYTLEFRALSQALQQSVGAVTSKTCRARFADAPTPIPNARCGLLAGDWTVTGTLNGVTSRQVFRDSSRTEADDWFGEGVLTFTSGENAGLSGKVKTYTPDGTFTLQLPMPFAVQVGDTYTALAGCRKRLEDCRDKFANLLNFQGEPHLPGPDLLTARPS